MHKGESHPEDWEVVEENGPTGSRKLYYHRPSDTTTYCKPDHLKTSAELARDNYLRNGDTSISLGYSDEDAESSKYIAPASVDTAIDSGNVGFKMLQKFGWKGSEGLGKEGKGITAPIQVKSSQSSIGLGKQEEYDRVIQEVTRERRKLDVEVEQTADMLEKKEATALREQEIEIDLKKIHREFYCDICDKQYKNVSEMASHLSSYDHHHKKRFKEMKQDQKRRFDGPDRGDEKKRKEERRSVKEMERRAREAQALSTASSADRPTMSETAEGQQQSEPTTVPVDHSLPPTGVSAKPIKFGLSMKKGPVKKK